MQNSLGALSLNPCKTFVRAGSAEARERRRHDPFLSAMSRQRKAANVSRQQELAKEREAAQGNPVESEPTEFIQKLQAQMEPENQTSQGRADLAASYHNHFLQDKTVQDAFQYSDRLTSPVKNLDRDMADPQAETEAEKKHEQDHAIAQEAVSRIVNIGNGNSKDRLRVNFMSCIDEFGRHNTDLQLPHKPSGSHPRKTRHLPKPPRVGPDTGSPEVQISILTAKIMNLSRHLTTANTDRHNKRNLRILVHKRQKMLKYLRRKERGGPRFQRVMEQLGLSDAAWKGEISM